MVNGTGDFRLVGAAPEIYHLKQPNYPQFRFEWHPRVKKVYLIREPAAGVTQVAANCIADEVDTHGAAHMTVLVWLRGWIAGRADA